MELQPLAEYSFGEFALSEYSLSRRRHTVSTDFEMVAGTLTSAPAQAINHVVFSSFGLSTGLAETQYKQIFDTSGHPLSTTALNTYIQAVTQTHHKGKGVGAAVLQGHTVTLTSYDEESITTPSIKGGAFHNTKADALASVVVVVPSLSITHTDYESAGETITDLQTLYKQKIDYIATINGSASPEIHGFRKIFIATSYKELSEAFLIIPTSIVIDSLINPAGNVELFFERAGYIWDNLEDALEIINRPYEERLIIRPWEKKTILHTGGINDIRKIA